MTKPQELKPCPFCSGAKVYVRTIMQEADIFCPECETNGPVHDSEAEAIAAWNNRTFDPAVREARIEGLEAANRELGMLSIADLEQAQEAWEAQKAAEAALAASEARVVKLVEAAREVLWKVAPRHEWEIVALSNLSAALAAFDKTD